MAFMNTVRYNHDLVSAQGKLFVIGGYNTSDGPMSVVECFRVWGNIAALSTARFNLAVAVLGDKLYAIGGRDSQRQCLNRAALQLQCLRSVGCWTCQSRTISGPPWPR